MAGWRGGMTRALLIVRRLAGSIRPLLPDLQDLHLYGGAGLVALGVARVAAPGYGLIVAGVALFYLGIRASRVATLRLLSASTNRDSEAA